MESQSKRKSNQKAFAISFGLLMLFVSPAFSQIQHGTIAVISFSHEKIIVAADSRRIFADRKDLPPDDSACKIFAFDGDVIFLSSIACGYRPLSSTDSVQGWTNEKEAHVAYQQIIDAHFTAKGHIKQIAEKWAESIETKFKLLYSVHPEKVIAIAREEDFLTVGVFGGFDLSGELVLYQTSISFVEPTGRISHTTTDKSCPGCIYALGMTEIAYEFGKPITERAKAEAKKLNPKDADPDVARTLWLVDMVIKYHDGNEVGGAVDAVELSRDGVRWIARKPNCPEKW
jgi:hypothetical protein